MTEERENTYTCYAKLVKQIGNTIVIKYKTSSFNKKCNKKKILFQSFEIEKKKVERSSKAKDKLVMDDTSLWLSLKTQREGAK